MDMSQYRDLFISESREHVRSIGELIVRLEEGGGREQIDALFRAAHSVKGMAASMGYGEITELAHRIEDLMDRVRREGLAVDAVVADLLLTGADLLEAMIGDVENGGTGSRDIAPLLKRIVGYTPGDTPSPAASAEAKEIVPPASPPPTVPESRSAGEAGKGEVRHTVRVRTDILDHLVNVTGELITNKHRIMEVAEELGSPRLDDAVAELTKLLRQLHNEVTQVRLMPFASIADRFPRLVRDLARRSGKEVTFEFEGKEIELDRGILEELSDPLVHILRNAVDHGMETVAERVSAGKPAKGRILLSVCREKDQVIVTVGDDGRGMDPVKLVASAVEKGLLKQEAGWLMPPREAFMLICLPGFSTAKEVTDISGRGVGMDAVRAAVQSLGGSMTVESEVGTGSRFILRLPLTIAIINVLLVGVAGRTVALPVTAIQRTLELGRESLSTSGKHKVFEVDGEKVPLLSLNRILGLPLTQRSTELLPVVVSEIRGRRVGLVVDRFLGHREVFVKPLGRPLASLKGVSGGTILGNGEVVFILDVANLI